VRRPSGTSITTRQVWAYRRVTRGLREFLQIAESIRDGEAISPDIEVHLANLGSQVNRDVVESFLNSYAEKIAGVLELGVSKLEQVYRLPTPMALTGLLAGKLSLQEDIVEVRELSFSQLRKAISSHEKKRKFPAEDKTSANADHALNELEKIICTLSDLQLSKVQHTRLKALAVSLTEFGGLKS
jgi:hypothetical protein